MNKDIIVLYCAVLKTTLIKQTLMSLRSLREHCCVPYEIPVVIITDQKSLFLSIAQLTSSTLKNVIFWEVTSEEAYKWMGTNQNCHFC